MATSIDRARADVQAAFAKLLARADEGGKCPFGEFETQTWTLLLALGRSLVVLFLLRAAQRPRAAEYAVGDARYMLGPEREAALGTRFGKVVFARPVGRRIGQPRAACDLPVDRELGLCSGFSLGVVTDLALLCAQTAFAAARHTFRQFCGWCPARAPCSAWSTRSAPRRARSWSRRPLPRTMARSW